ncbi:MAG: hypothetical protein Q7J85_01440 [Bacillota bacterium]|nr:hypothetical protein [Bacillota bacterium]MDP2196344.1 hypothetical protein [Rhodocyclaceae bacterium]
MKSRHPLSIRFSSPEIEWLESESSRRRQTISEILRQAVKREMQTADLREGLQALEARFDFLEKSIDQIGNLIVSESEKLQKGIGR